jgi:ubiquinone/menaquinone biosynthesis C-methylase UbiE
MYWTELPAVRRRLNTIVSGSPDHDWVDHTIAAHLDKAIPVARCLSLRCGKGGLERRLASAGVFAACDGLDISESQLAIARQRAQDAGLSHIQYRREDLNYTELPENAYDLIWSHGAIHHIERLEHHLEQLDRALKAGGLFVLLEYVGPSRFQFDARRRELIEACYAILPAACKALVPREIEARLARNPINMGLRWTLSRTRAVLRERRLGAVLRRR